MNKYTILLCIILILECQSKHKRVTRRRKHTKGHLKRHLKNRNRRRNSRTGSNSNSGSNSGSRTSSSYSSTTSEEEDSCKIHGFGRNGTGDLFNHGKLKQFKKFKEYPYLFRNCAIVYNDCYDSTDGAVKPSPGCKAAFEECQETACDGLDGALQDKCNLYAAENLVCLALPEDDVLEAGFYLQIAVKSGINVNQNTGEFSCTNNETYHCFLNSDTTDVVEIGPCDSTTAIKFTNTLPETPVNGDEILRTLNLVDGGCLRIEDTVGDQGLGFISNVSGSVESDALIIIVNDGTCSNFIFDAQSNQYFLLKRNNDLSNTTKYVLIHGFLSGGSGETGTYLEDVNNVTGCGAEDKNVVRFVDSLN